MHDSLRVVFARSYRPIGVLVQLRTLSKWSHVGVVLPCGEYIIESRGGIGVVKTHISDFEIRYCEVCYREIPCISLPFALRVLYNKLGSPYDGSGFFRLPWKEKWDVVSGYQCAEIVGLACGLYGIKHLRKLTPKDLWKICKDTDYRIPRYYNR